MRTKAGLPLLFLLAGCGSGNEPLSILSQSNATPLLMLPMRSSLTALVGTYSQSGAVGATANDGWDFTVNTTLGAAVSAAGPGLVSYVDATANAGVVMIVHNTHLMSRVSRLATVTVQPGATVVAGSPLGTMAIGVQLHFSTFFDNGFVCPLGYLAASEQGFLVTNLAAGGINPCR